MDAHRNLKEQRTWRIVLVSTGEISVTDKLEEDGKSCKGGQLIRFLDVPFDEPTMTNELADELKAACCDVYGTAGEEFLKRLVSKYGTFLSLSADIARRIEQSRNMLAVESLPAEKKRAMKRFELILASNLLATELGVLPLSADEITQSVRYASRLWLSSETAVSDAARGVIALRDYISKNQEHKFKPYPISDDAPNIRRDIAGYFDANEEVFYLTDGGMKEACNGYNKSQVCQQLDQMCLLKRAERDRFTSKITVAGQRISVYAVRASILELDSQDMERDNRDERESRRQPFSSAGFGQLPHAAETGLPWDARDNRA
jgi:putative DNA primase/helicase